QAGPAAGGRPGGGGGMGLLLGLRVHLRGAVSAVAWDRAGFRHRLLGTGGLHEQSGAGARGGKRTLRRAQRPGEMAAELRHAAGPPGGLHPAGTADADVLAALSAQGSTNAIPAPSPATTRWMTMRSTGASKGMSCTWPSTSVPGASSASRAFSTNTPPSDRSRV